MTTEGKKKYMLRCLIVAVDLDASLSKIEKWNLFFENFKNPHEYGNKFVDFFRSLACMHTNEIIKNALLTFDVASSDLRYCVKNGNYDMHRDEPEAQCILFSCEKYCDLPCYAISYLWDTFISACKMFLEHAARGISDTAISLNLCPENDKEFIEKFKLKEEVDKTPCVTECIHTN